LRDIGKLLGGKLHQSSTSPERKIEDLLEAGKTENAVELLFDLAISCANNKDFINAEAYRDWLYEVDSMALSKIVKVNEVIEKTKSNAFTPEFRQLWSPFFEGLSDQEAGVFFFTLQQQILESDKVILTQGEPNERLYLVRSGRLKVVYSDREKELLIHTMGRGDYFGHDTFFSPNVCTASVKTLTETSLGFIERETLNNMPGGRTTLLTNLKKVCDSGMSTFDRIKQKGMDRRSFKRIKFNTKVSFRLLPSERANTMQRSVKAELWDISKGGLSFYFRSKSSESVKRLIGRKIEVRIKLNDEDRPRVIVAPGTVHGIGSHPMDEFSVHVKFERKFSDAAIKTIQNIATQ
jgi:CRP-like cAMP-binding protein